jgi:hypothetical protein
VSSEQSSPGLPLPPDPPAPLAPPPPVVGSPPVPLALLPPPPLDPPPSPPVDPPARPPDPLVLPANPPTVLLLEPPEPAAFDPSPAPVPFVAGASLHPEVVAMIQMGAAIPKLIHDFFVNAFFMRQGPATTVPTQPVAQPAGNHRHRSIDRRRHSKLAQFGTTNLAW